MAIRFACPSCRQPIEIDDQWAGQSVGCPYCKNVVTAPSSSNWPPGEIPVATPAGSAFETPPPPPPGIPAIGTGRVPPTPVGPSSAPKALLLAITCAVLSCLGAIVWMAVIATAAEEKVGPNPTEQEVAQALQDLMMSGQMPKSPAATAIVLIGALCGIGGIALSIRSLLRQEPRRGMAIAACIISVCFVICQGFLTIVMNFAGPISPP